MSCVTSPHPQEPGSKFDSEDMIKENQLDLIRLLVAHGASLSASDNTGATAKDLANDNDFYECVDLIKELEGASFYLCLFSPVCVPLICLVYYLSRAIHVYSLSVCLSV